MKNRLNTWYQNNKEKVKTKSRLWKEKNPERYAELKRQARERHREKLGIQPRVLIPEDDIPEMVAALKTGVSIDDVAEFYGWSPTAVAYRTAPWKRDIKEARRNGPGEQASERTKAIWRHHVARQAGEKRFFGLLCTRHPELKGERWRGGKCVACGQEYKRKWSSNPDRRAKEAAKRRVPPEEKARRVAERAARRDVKLAAKRAEREARAAERAAQQAARQTPEAVKAAKKKERDRYYESHPEKRKVLRRQNKAKRRAAEKWVETMLTAEEQRRLSEIYAKARRLTVETGYQWDVHHKLPLSKGGLHHPDNLEAVPAYINQAIGDTPMSAEEYIFS